MVKTAKLLLLFLLMIGLSSCNDNTAQSSLDDGSAISSAASVVATTDVIEQVKHGDFSHVTADNELELGRLQGAYDHLNDDLELVKCQLNEDGLVGLVFQEQDGYYHEKMKRIECIVAVKENQGKVVFCDAGSRFFWFLGDNGNLVYFYNTQGTTEWDRFSYWTYDDDLNMVDHYTLEVTYIEPWYEEQVREELAEWWADDESREGILNSWGSGAKSLDELIKNNPERTTTGEYYERYTGNGEDAESLTQEQFSDAFEELTGFSYYLIRPNRDFGGNWEKEKAAAIREPISIGSDKVSKIKTKNGFGLIDNETGEILLQPFYQLITDYSEGIAFAKKDEIYSAFDESGQMLFELPKTINNVKPFEDGLAMVFSYGIDPKFTENNTVAFHDQGGYGYFGCIDHSGNYVLPLKFHNSLEQYNDEKSHHELIYWNDRNTMLVRDASKDYKWGLIDRTGAYVMEPVYDWVGTFREGLADVKIADEQGDRWGFINVYGEPVIDLQYEWIATEFYQGLSGVVQGGKCGFIDLQGNMVIQPQYDYVLPFDENGYAVVFPVFLIVKDYANIEGASEDTYGYYETAYFVYNYYIIDHTGKKLFTAEQLIKTDSWPDSYLIERYLADTHRTAAEYSGIPHRQTFENMVVSKPFIGLINAENNEEGRLEIIYEYPPLDVIDGNVS